MRPAYRVKLLTWPARSVSDNEGGRITLIDCDPSLLGVYTIDVSEGIDRFPLPISVPEAASDQPAIDANRLPHPPLQAEIAGASGTFLSHCPSHLRIVVKGRDGLGKGGRITRRNDETVPSVFDRFHIAAGIGHDRGLSRRERLENDEREGFPPRAGEREHVTLAQDSAYLWEVQQAGKDEALLEAEALDLRFILCGTGPVADVDEAHVCPTLES